MARLRSDSEGVILQVMALVTVGALVSLVVALAVLA